MNWDTRALHGDACDKFTSYTTNADEGRKILDEIARIKERLDKMDDLKEVRVASCNDSTWHPEISVDVVKNFVRVQLEKRRDELRTRFNNIFGSKK